MATNYLILDLATTGIDNAADFISVDDIEAPANYKDPVKIAAYCEDKRRERIDAAALDLDLARITALGVSGKDESGAAKTKVYLVKDEDTEAALLLDLAIHLKSQYLVSFNGLRYDWPLLMRRALYLDIDFPDINLDRYRTEHIDVWDRLSYHGVIKAHSLTWYAKRFGWVDLSKPLSGAEEAQAPSKGQWDELRASVQHDVMACERLAVKMGILR